MNRSLAAFCAVMLVVLTASFGAQLLRSDPEHAKPDHVAPAAAPALGTLPLAAVGSDPSPLVAYFATVAYDAQIAEAQHAQEEAARMAQTRSPSVGRVARTGTYEGVGDCTGFAIPDYVIERESGGNPFAVNASSGAFGCAQVMPMHWAPGGACAGLDRYSVDDQRTCVDWLSQGGTRLSPWAATR
jgi:hypothetical protein